MVKAHTTYLPKGFLREERWRFFVIVLFAALLLVISFAKMRDVLISLGFVAACIVIRSYKRALPDLPIEIELVTFTIAVLSAVFGFWHAIIAGLTGFFFGDVLNKNVNVYLPLSAGFYAAMAVLAMLLPDDIIIRGIILTLVNAIGQFAFYHIVIGYDQFKNGMYSATNIVFNLLLFTKIAPAIVALMG